MEVVLSLVESCSSMAYTSVTCINALMQWQSNQMLSYIPFCCRIFTAAGNGDGYDCLKALQYKT